MPRMRLPVWRHRRTHSPAYAARTWSRPSPSQTAGRWPTRNRRTAPATMAPELSPALVRSALELAGAAGPGQQEDTPPAPPAIERLGAHPVLRYAVADEAE